MTESEEKRLVASWLKAVQLPPPAQYEIFHLLRERRRVGWADKKPKLESFSLSEGLCLRVLENGGQGVLTTTSKDEVQLKRLANEALETARRLPKDPHRRLLKAHAHQPLDPPIDETLFTQSNSSLLDLLESLEHQILKKDSRIKKVIKLQYQEERETRTAGNSLSLLFSNRSTSATFMVEVLAEEKGQTEVAWEFQSRRFAKGLSLERVAENTAALVLRSLGGRPLPSGRYPVLVPPRVGAPFLSLLSEALSAEAVQRSRSFLKGCLNQPVASSVVTFVDDPFLAEGVQSAAFDDEGVPHQTLAVIEDGTLKSYFHDLRSSSADSVEPTGHGIKASLAAAPRPNPTNFYMKPGKSHVGDLLSAHPRLFVLQDVMGLHMADPMTGEFSLGASGFLYEKGSFQRAVRGVTIAGQLKDFFKKITAVGDDLTWYGSFGAPSFLVEALAVAGT